LFSESNGRWLVEVEPSNKSRFEKKVKSLEIGEVTSKPYIETTDGKTKASWRIDKLRRAWSNAVAPEVQE
jgi:phosphoribosylformylglycinamidine (FGAM) synthase-like enzyme